MAPDLNGWSLGSGFVRAGLDFACRQWRVSRFRLEVMAFNRRVIEVYTRLGFVPAGRFSRAAPELDGQVVAWITMEVAAAPAARREGDHG